MATPPDNPAPALDPGRKALSRRPLDPAQSSTPSVVGTNAPPTCVVYSDPSTFGADWFSVEKRDRLGLTALPRFRKLLEDHNVATIAIDEVRREILRVASAEAAAVAAGTAASLKTNLLATIIDLNNRKSPTRRTNDLAGYQALTARLIEAGNRNVFDPWNGWWAGEFVSQSSSGATTYFNLHIWDPTVDVNELGYAQRIQAVTQVTATRSSGIWFASALHMEDHPALADRYDHAINVWSPEDGITGFVKKNLGRDEKWLPHVGFLLDSNTLLWVAWERPPHKLSADGPVTVLMFVETGFANGSLNAHYEIRGALLSAEWKAGAFSINKTFDDIGLHFGDYKAVMPLVDHGSLKCAIATAALGDMDAKLADKIIAKTKA